MKQTFLALTIAAVMAASLRASAQGAVYTRVTYQGFLKDNGISADGSNGHYDFRYGVVIGPLDPDNPWRTNCPNCLTTLLGTNSITVNQGLFITTLMMPTGMLHSVTMNGTNVFLEFAVRTNGGGAFTVLEPLQPLSATPYAVVAQSVSGPIPATSLTGGLPAAALGGSYGNPLSFLNAQNVFAGNGSLLANVNATTLGGFGPCNLPCYWNIQGNGGTDPATNFLGTTDNVALTIRVNDKPALKIFPDIVIRPNDLGGINPPVEPMESPNILGGFLGNFLHPNNKGVTLAGGGSRYDHVFHSPVDLSGRNEIGQFSDYSFLGSGSANFLKGPHNAIVAGHYNHINDANYAFIGSGGENLITHPIDSGAIVAGYKNTITGSDNTNFPSGDVAFIGAGHDNLATNFAAFIGAGGFNVAGGAYSVVAGGSNNVASGQFSTIPGGTINTASGSTSLAAGNRAKAMHAGTYVWSDSQGTDFASTSTNQYLIRAAGGVGIGTTTPVMQLHVQGDTRVTGLFRSGSETGTSLLPSPAGLVVRRINSTSAAVGQVVARNDHVTLERDGSNGGMIIRYPAGAFRQAIACTAMTSAGAQLNFYTTLAGGPGSTSIYYNATNVVQFHCTFGDPFNSGHHTEVYMIREGTDFYWVGTLTSTYNQ